MATAPRKGTSIDEALASDRLQREGKKRLVFMRFTRKKQLLAEFKGNFGALRVEGQSSARPIGIIALKKSALKQNY